MSKVPQPPALKIPKRATPADQIPRVVIRPTLDDHLEIMTRAVFQAGLSWAAIAGRWPAFQTGFDRFAVTSVMRYGEADVDRLMDFAGIVHSRKKIAGTIANARSLVALERECGTIGAYCARYPTYRELFSDARKRFAFLGDLSCYYWLFRTGNRVPRFERWITEQQADHPRMREMVELGRKESTSAEEDGF